MGRVMGRRAIIGTNALNLALGLIGPERTGLERTGLKRARSKLKIGVLDRRNDVFPIWFTGSTLWWP